MTILKSIFVKPEIKQIVELQQSLNSLSMRSVALESLLEESETYRKLKEQLKKFK